MDYRFTESSFENALLELLEQQDYRYECGYDIHRTNAEIILVEDFKEYLNNRYSSLNLQDEEIDLILHNLYTARGTSVYISMNKTLDVLRNGITLDRSQYNLPTELIEFFDYGDTSEVNNVYKVVNQFEFKEFALRRPDIIVFINGIPVSIFELKNMADDSVTIHDAYMQLHNYYMRDIPDLMRYSLISVISDGVNTKFGSLFAGYKHFFPWKSVDGINYSQDGIDSLLTLVKGLFNHKTLLNVIKNYIYFPDTSKKDLMILPKYSQYYATELLYNNVKNHLRPNGDGKGGTYFGATGCGKSYTMLFLTRRLVTSPDMCNPTVVLLTDRTDLDDQLSETFEASKKYLIDDNTMQISSRAVLNEQVRGVTSGGIYLMTAQKFDEDVQLLSDRTNIICISDEAHRTQVNLDAKYNQTDDGIKKKYGFAHYIRNSFPNATYVGFTGTPIDSTITVFGPIVASYKMKQAVDDGSTVEINLLPGPSAVQLDETKLKIVDKYYEEQLKNDTNEYQVEQSKKEMATVRTIIDNDKRLGIVVDHFIKHYEERVKESSTVKGKAMFVCYDRKIAYKVYNLIQQKRPDWFIKRKTQEDESTLSYEELNKLKEVEMVKLIATPDKIKDDTTMLNLLGDGKHRTEMALLFKNENSNLKIAIVVDMWLTGFDCECLDTMYLDKPLERHSLIQTISRVNRVFDGKDKGLVVDYIGIEASLAKAMQLYSGDINPVSQIEATLIIFKDQLALLQELMHGFDYSKFENGSDLDRLLCLQKGIEFVHKTKDRETRFMGLTLRMKKAFDLCVGDERITPSEISKAHFFHSIRCAILKMGHGETPDATRMNAEVKRLVDACITVYSEQEEGEVHPTNIFSSEYLKKIEGIPYKNTKFKMLLELLRKAIKAYGQTNKIKSLEFSERMKKLVERYNNRDGEIMVSSDDVINDFIDELSAEAKKILADIEKDANEFKKMGITFEEKAFYDILISIRDKYKFEYPDVKVVSLAKKVKEIVDDKSKYVDFTTKSDIKANFQSDIIRLLNKNGYPPITFMDIYEKVLDQVENFKKYN